MVSENVLLANYNTDILAIAIFLMKLPHSRLRTATVYLEIPLKEICYYLSLSVSLHVCVSEQKLAYDCGAMDALS